MNTALAKPLDRDERRELERLEAVVTLYGRAFLDVGHALLEISRQRLYRETHATFREYLAARWPDLSRSRAYQLMDAAGVADSLEGDCPPMVDNERQARALASVPEEDRRGVWEEAAAEAGGAPSGSKIAEVAARKAFAGLTPEEQLEVVRGEEERVVSGAAGLVRDRRAMDLARALVFLRKAMHIFRREGDAGARAIDAVMRAITEAEALAGG